MKKYIITISRQFGSLGRHIAKELAGLLNIEYYDRDIIEAAAKKLGLPVSKISESEESARGGYFRMKFPLGIQSTSVQDQIFEAQKHAIEELAEKESCIIVGRCSDAILENYPNHLHLFIYAPYADRYWNSMNSLMMSAGEAKKLIAEVDRARLAYHLKYAGFAPEDLEHKDMLINSSMLGVTGTAQQLAHLVKTRFTD